MELRELQTEFNRKVRKEKKRKGRNEFLGALCVNLSALCG